MSTARLRALVPAVALVLGAACAGGDDAGGSADPAPAPTSAADVTTADQTTADLTTPETTTPETTTPATAAPGVTTPDDQGAPDDDSVPDHLVDLAALSVFGDDRPGATGEGVVIVVVDSGADVRHPDLRAADGSTRVEAIVDMTGQTAGCAADRPPPTVTRRAEIDRVLTATEATPTGEAGPVMVDGELIGADVVGRGTAHAGLAAGNGAASEGWLAGAAPDATLVVVKQVSEGVPPSAVGPGGLPVLGCLDDALDEIDRILDELATPAVLLMPTGAQWGPLDGTSAASRRLEQSFGPDAGGRVLVTGAGDEGGGANHARIQVTTDDPVASVPFERQRAEASNPTLWYQGDTVRLSVRFDDGTVVGPVDAGASVDVDGVRIVHYEPGTEFHPWTSTSGDRSAWILIDRPASGGEILVELATDGSARVDVFGDLLGPRPGASSITFGDHLASARVTDVASTSGAVVVGSHLARSSWVDGRGRLVEPTPVVEPGAPWPGTSTGPTRDGRDVVVVSAPGQHAVAPLATGSVLAERDELHAVTGPDGPGRYVVVTGTGSAAAIVAGVVASMLEVDPSLTSTEVADLLAATASDGRLAAAAAVDAARPTDG